MPCSRRAKIFAPFDALKGFSEAVASKDVLYRDRVILTPEDQEELDRLWLDAATSAAHEAGLPAYVDVVLKTNTTTLKEFGATEFIQTTTADAVRFTKPRGAKE